MVGIRGKPQQKAPPRRKKRDGAYTSRFPAPWNAAGLLIFCILLWANESIPKADYQTWERGTSDNSLRHKKQSTTASCEYHGNCPVGSVCALDKGICLPYIPLGNTPTTKNTMSKQLLEYCADTCLAELEVDEGYLFNALPVIQSKMVAASPHLGCVLSYERQRREPTSWTERPPLQSWLHGRFRQVVRVDSNRSGTANDWIAFCQLPCQASADCQQAGQSSKHSCLGRDTSQLQPLQEELSTKINHTCQVVNVDSPKADMVIVSGADDRYFDALENFAASALFWAPNRKLVVYNLGMSQEHLNEVRAWPNVHNVHWTEGVPKTYPDHVQDLHTYAWKSIIINETVHEYKSIFWLDAGATFTGPIQPIEEILHRHGIFLVKGQDDHMKYKSHPDTYKWFGFDKDTYTTGPHWAGGIQGHVYPSRYIDNIVIPNAKCALDKNCIAPRESNLLNHRYDQTSLSILGYQPHIRPPAHTLFLAADRSQLGPSLGESSTQYLFWTARGGCTYYSDKRKGLDSPSSEEVG